MGSLVTTILNSNPINEGVEDRVAMLFPLLSKIKTHGMKLSRENAQVIFYLELIKTSYDCSDSLMMSAVNTMALDTFRVFTRKHQKLINTIICLKRVRVIMEFMLLLKGDWYQIGNFKYIIRATFMD